MNKLVCLALSMLAVSCGSAVEAPPFRILYPDNRAGSIESILARVGRPAAGAPQNARGIPLAVVASRGLVVAHDLSHDRRMWQVELTASSRPVVTRTAVIFLAGDDVVALASDSGRLLWRFPREESFLGAAATAEVAYLVFGTAVSAVASITERRAGALVAVDMHSGDELWRVEADRQFGAPQVAGDLVLLPWERQYVSAFVGATGAEIARLRSTDDVISFISARREGIFYGGRGLYRLTARAAAGTKAGQTYLAIPEPVPLPGEPRVGPDVYVPAVDEAARDKIQVFWQPAVADLADLSLSGDLVYFLYYRYVFGIAHADGAVKWATRLPQDAVAATATEGGLFVVDGSGSSLFLDATDGLIHQRSRIASPPVIAATYDVGSFRPQANVETAGAAGTPEAATLRARLLEMAMDRDNRLVPARAFAARLLGRETGEDVTADLVQVMGRTDVPQAIRDAAAQGLEGRTSGAAALVGALGPHYDFLAHTQPGPVAILAQVLASVRERRAVAPLLEHLDDPHTSPATLAAIAKALGEIGDRAALEPLLVFLHRYHADNALGERPPALAEAARSIARLGGRGARPKLEAIAADPSALPFVRDAVREALAGPEPPEPPAEPAAAAAPAPASAAGAAPAAVATPEPPPLPRSIPVEQIRATLEPHLAALRRCMGPGPEGAAPPARLRLVFGIVGATGKAEHLSITPAPPDPQTPTCLTTAFAAIEFAHFSENRQRVTYTLERTPPAPAARPRPAGTPRRGQQPPAPAAGGAPRPPQPPAAGGAPRPPQPPAAGGSPRPTKAAAPAARPAQGAPAAPAH